MYKKKKILALVPARGGSKGIKDKNIKLLCGKPLISYAIQNGLKSRYIDDVYVSSDSRKILDVAKKYKARTILRPKKFASDTAKSIDAIKHAVQTLGEEGREYDWIVLLQPTSPLLSSSDIDKAIEQFFKDKNEVMLPISPSHVPPGLLIRKQGKKLVFEDSSFFSDVRRQKLPSYYVWCGALFIYTRKALFQLKDYSYIPNKTGGFVLPKHTSFEIDTMEDFFIVESIMKNLSNR